MTRLLTPIDLNLADDVAIEKESFYLTMRTPESRYSTVAHRDEDLALIKTYIDVYM